MVSKPKSKSILVHFKDLAQQTPGVPVILIARVSSPEQRRKGNIEDQLSRMRKKVKRRGSKVIKEYCEVAQGKNVRRATVRRAIRKARRTGAAIVFETMDRMLRHIKFNPKTNPNARVSDKKIERFLNIHRCVTFALLDNPKSSLKKIKRLRAKRGQRAKGNHGGGDNKPGKMVRRREKLLPRAIKLRKKGWSFRRIGERLGIAPMVACDWWHKREMYRF